ncbi:TonB-dependent receptor [Christiangramia gaetbulicola]|nr:TonB-dependent receptor [Christiangramia gaetbulicola]
MKRFLLLLFLSLHTLVFSQNDDKVTIDVQDKTIEEVFEIIESNTNYRFYFIKDWIPEKRLSGNFENAKIETILNAVLDETVLNYFLLDEKVIITENSIIYNDFSNGFFENKSLPNEIALEQDETEEKAPIFYESTNEKIETVKIGRETGTLSKRKFVIKGRITEKETNAPLSNVAIILGDGQTGTVSDIDGYYSLELPQGIHMLTTRSMGNTSVTKRVIIYNNGELNFNLGQNLEMLNEVVIESESDKNVRQAFAGVSQIKAQEIKTIPLVLGERDLLKVAATLPGISKAGEGSSGYNVRGGRADQNLILLDDAVIYNPNHFFGIFSALNPFTTGVVDIYKGTIPAKYGGRLSSVIDIKTKNGNSREFSGEGSIGPVTGNLSLEVPVVKEKSSLVLGARATYSDWILNSLDEESLKNSEASFYDVIAKYNHQIDAKNELNFTAYLSSDRFSITSDSLFAYKNRMFSVSYEKEFNRDLTGSLILSNSNYEFNIDYDSDFNNNFKSGFSINDFQLQAILDHRISSDHTLNYGISSKFYSLIPGIIDPLGDDSLIESRELAKEKGLESAIFISDDFEISPDFTINGGLRFSVFNALGPDEVNIYDPGQPRTEASVISTENYANNEVVKTYSGLEYRLTGRYSILDDLSIKGGYSTTYQYIHTLSNNTTVSPTDIYKLSDFNVEPQKATQYSLGVFKNFNENMYELSLEGYFKQTEGIIDFKTGATLFLNENIETEILDGEGQSYGIEVLLRKNLGDLNGWLGYTYSRSLIKLDSPFESEVINNGEYFPSNFDKPHDFSAVLNYKFTKRFSISSNLIYQTGRPVTVPIGKYDYNDSEFVVYSERNQYRIPDYYRLDLSLNIEGNHKIEKLAHSFWNISIYNVLGRNNPYSVFFVTEDGSVQAYQSSIFAVPIPTITYNFKF